MSHHEVVTSINHQLKVRGPVSGQLDTRFDTSSHWVLNGKLFRTSREPCILLNKTPRPRNYCVVIYWHENELPVTFFYCRNNLSFCLDTCFIALDDY